MDVIQKTGLSEEKPCRIIVLDNNVPQIFSLLSSSKGDSVPQAERKDWHVSYELGDAWESARKIKLKNSSLFKVEDFRIFSHLHWHVHWYCLLIQFIFEQSCW